MSSTPNDRLHDLLEPLASEAGVDLEGVSLTKVGGSRVLDVVVDADGGVDLDVVAELSRAFSAVLDGPGGTAVLGDGEYRLEVGSPGVDRLLTLPRHWRRALTRLVTVHLAGAGEVTGRVQEADEDGVLLEIAPVKGKGRATERRIEYTAVARARVQVEFNRKGLDDDPLADGVEPDAEDDGIDADDVDELDDDHDIDENDTDENDSTEHDE